MLLEVKNLSKQFIVNSPFIGKAKTVDAVKDISFAVGENETVGLIGESGSGKSTTALLLTQLIEPTCGEVLFCGKSLTHISKEELRTLRKDFQIVFQHTMAVLDPKMTILKQVIEPLKCHAIVPKHELESEALRLLHSVGMSSEDSLKFPQQLSGGQYQRVIIARAIATRPKLIVCDEPVSALDVSVQGQILNLLMELQKSLNLSYVFISHDIKVVRALCQRIAVMYKGEIVEMGETSKVLTAPQHAHTKALLEAML